MLSVLITGLCTTVEKIDTVFYWVSTNFQNKGNTIEGDAHVSRVSEYETFYRTTC